MQRQTRGSSLIGSILLAGGQSLFSGVGAPVSGTSGTGRGTAGTGSRYINRSNGAMYWNEGTAAAPYWTPVDLSQDVFLGVRTDFRSGLGKAVADTAASALIADGSGVRVHGQGIAETDSGLTVAFAEGGPVASLITTDELEHTAALSHGDTTPQFQPDTHGPLVIDCDIAMSSAITARSLFVGFVGIIADAIDPPVTGATVTATLVLDDLAGVIFDTGLTAAARLYAVHNKSDAAASQNVTTGGRDTGVDFPAAGTYCRLRVEISAAGAMTIFKNKVQVASVAAALDVDEEVAPVLLVRSLATATKTMLVKRFAAWGYRG
jgi:hypothetical protein